MIVTLHDLITAGKEDLTAALAPQGQSVSKTSPTLPTLQLQYLKHQHVNPSVALATLTSANIKDAQRQAVEQAAVLEAKLQSHQQQVAEFAEQTLLAQQRHAEREKQQTQSHLRCNRELESLKCRLADLSCTVPASDRGGQPTLQGQTEATLRLTGLPEEDCESDDHLLQRVQSILDQLPRKVSAEAARRQGRYGSKKARAVVITFASMQDRLDTLRAKAALNKDDSTRGYSIHEILNPEEQMQKNAMWPIFLQAKRDRRRASFRGANLFIDGQLIPGPLQTDPAWDLGQMQMPGLVSNQAFPPLPPALPSMATNPLAQQQNTNFIPSTHHIQQHDTMQIPAIWMPYQQQQAQHAHTVNGRAPLTPLATRPMRPQ